MEYLKIAVRSLLQRWRQYVALFFVAAVGTAISLFLLFTVEGMLSALSQKARVYYAGDLLLLGRTNGSEYLRMSQFERCSELFSSRYIVVPRFEYQSTYTGALYFDGNSARQRYIKGVDFALEHELFKQYYYTEGSCDGITGTNGILLSESIAEQLDCHVDDQITLMLQTKAGYTNTVSLTVKGVFRDSSIFGMYTSYVDIDVLRDAAGEKNDFINRIGFISKTGSVSSLEIKNLHNKLSTMYAMYHLVNDKDEYLNATSSGRYPGEIFALIPLAANMDELNIIIAAMRAITALVIVVLVLIIIIGISSTYKVIISKRINEIGIYKSIGMIRSSVYILIGSEAVTLLVAGSLLGVFLSFGLCGLIQLFNFTAIPSFDIFLTGGILVPSISLAGIFAICAIVIVTTLVAVLFSVRDAVKKMPSEALATTA